MILSPVTSAEMPPAKIVHSRVELGAPAELPDLILAATPYSVIEFSHGGARLIGSRGEVWGLFVNKQLALQTAAALGLVLAR